MTTVRDVAKAGYGMEILRPTPVARAIGYHGRTLTRFVKPGQKWQAPAWLIRYGVYPWAKSLEG